MCRTPEYNVLIITQLLNTIWTLKKLVRFYRILNLYYCIHNYIFSLAGKKQESSPALTKNSAAECSHSFGKVGLSGLCWFDFERTHLPVFLQVEEMPHKMTAWSSHRLYRYKFIEHNKGQVQGWMCGPSKGGGSSGLRSWEESNFPTLNPWPWPYLFKVPVSIIAVHSKTAGRTRDLWHTSCDTKSVCMVQVTILKFSLF